MKTKPTLLAAGILWTALVNDIAAATRSETSAATRVRFAGAKPSTAFTMNKSANGAIWSASA